MRLNGKRLTSVLRLLLCGFAALLLAVVVLWPAGLSAQAPGGPPGAPGPPDFGGDFGNLGNPNEPGDPFSPGGDSGGGLGQPLPMPGSGVPSGPGFGGGDTGTIDTGDSDVGTIPTQGNPGSGDGLTNPLQFDTLEEFLVAILEAVVLIAFPLLVLMLVYAGFQFVTAQGNQAKLESARRTFLWTLVGAILVLGAQALAIAIQGTVEELRGSAERPAVAQSETLERPV